MSRIAALDAGPLGLVTNPNSSPKSVACAKWLQSLTANGVLVLIPEIANYEVRRELLRANLTCGIAKLDALAKLLEFVPITTSAMRLAAEFWAHARQQGQPTSGENTIH